MNPLSRLLDHLLGPRVWSVFRVSDADANTGWTFLATRYTGGGLPEGWTLIRSRLRREAAYRAARRLRQKVEDTPEALL